MKLILAPLAGYTDKAFRYVSYKYGAEETVSEMVSAEGIARESEKTKGLTEPFSEKEDLTIQLFGPDHDTFYRATKAFDFSPFKKIDINAGCPVPKVVKTGAGSALMKNVKEASEIIKTLKGETGKKVSIKFRLGWDENSINYLSFAEEAVKAGADELTLHARTRSQGYSGTARKEAFLELRKLFSNNEIILNASGDVFSAETALEYFNEYKMDGVMFARGAIGNPFIFREAKDLIEKGSYEKPSTSERVEAALMHLSLAVDYYGENIACREMRKTLPGYIKGLKDSSRVKDRLSRASTYEECENALSTLL